MTKRSDAVEAAAHKVLALPVIPMGAEIGEASRARRELYLALSQPADPPAPVSDETADLAIAAVDRTHPRSLSNHPGFPDSSNQSDAAAYERSAQVCEEMALHQHGLYWTSAPHVQSQHIAAALTLDDAAIRIRALAAQPTPPASDAYVRGHADREALGRLVREVWIAWAREQPAPKASWLVPWEDLSEPDREVDRRIGETLARAGRTLAAQPTRLPRAPTEGDDDGAR